MSCRFLLAGFQLSLIGRFWVSPEAMIRLYMDVLESVQKTKFDLGVDEYKRGVPMNRAAVVDADPNRIEREQRVLEAISYMDEVFRRRGIE